MNTVLKSEVENLIEVKDYSVKFRTFEGKVSALDHVNFSLSEGETLGIIGESGSGKSTLAMSLIGILSDNAETFGEVRYMDRKINETYESNQTKRMKRSSRKILDQRLAEIRWKEISVIFQGAMNAFNPVYTIKRQIMEVFKVHGTFNDISNYADEDLIDHETLLRNARKQVLEENPPDSEMKSGELEDFVRVRYEQELKNLKEQIPKMSEKQRRQALISKRLNFICMKAGFNPDFLDSFPHQLSGGMRQRAIISMALALNPKVVIADEPTTGLDVVTQAKIIKELKQLKKDHTIKGMIVVSHDVGVVAQLASKVMVMYAGRVMEYGTTEEVFNNPKNPYTISLLKSYPSLKSVKSRIAGIPGSVPDLVDLPPGCLFADRCFLAEEVCKSKSPEMQSLPNGSKSLCHFSDVDSNKYNDFIKKDLQRYSTSGPDSEHVVLLDVHNLSKLYPVHSSVATRLYGGNEKLVVHAVDGVSFQVKTGQIIGVVGESGSGKSTLGELIIDSIPATGGEIIFYLHDPKSQEEREISLGNISKSGRSYMIYRKENQLIFQDPYDSLNPKMTTFDIVAEPLIAQKNEISLRSGSQRRAEGTYNQNGPENGTYDIRDEVLRALDIANLRPAINYLDRFPHELSGGERQRVSIARAITLNPSFLVADEPISMLDVSIRANIMNVLLDLKERANISILYISHDIASARYISDYIMVMYLGKIVEYGPAEAITSKPLHPYTRALISSVPSTDPRWAETSTGIIGEIGNAINPKPGCRFYDRCVFSKAICKNEEPPKQELSDRYYFCHFAEDELVRNE